MLHASLPLGIKLNQAFSWMAALAQSLPIEQRQAALQLFAKLHSLLGETEVTVNIPVDHILCQSADELRRLGKHEEVGVLEELVKTLKGNQKRVITGGFNFTAQNLADLDGQLEKLRKAIIAGQ